MNSPVRQLIESREELRNLSNIWHITKYVTPVKDVRFAWQIIDSVLIGLHNYDVHVWVEEMWKWLWPQTLPWVTEENQKILNNKNVSGKSYEPEYEAGSALQSRILLYFTRSTAHTLCSHVFYLFFQYMFRSYWVTGFLLKFCVLSDVSVDECLRHWFCNHIHFSEHVHTT